jgi:hypothetical protein
MIRPLLLLAVLTMAACGVSNKAEPVQSGTHDPCGDDRRAWVGRSLIKMEEIKPGMTRKDLLKVFTTQGGLSTGLQRTFASRDCPYFQVDVEFRAVGRPNRDPDGRVTLIEDDRDVIISISRPYLDFFHTD